MALQTPTIHRVFVARRALDIMNANKWWQKKGVLAHSALLFATDAGNYILEYMSDAKSHLYVVNYNVIESYQGFEVININGVQWTKQKQGRASNGWTTNRAKQTMDQGMNGKYNALKKDQRCHSAQELYQPPLLRFARISNMINTEHIIKRKVVSYEAYNQDSDEEFMNNYRMDPRRKKHARRRQYDPKYYDNDSDFESTDEDEEKKNKNRLRKQASFDKVQISANQRSRGALSHIMASMSPILGAHNAAPAGRAVARSIKDKYRQSQPRFAESDRNYDGALLYNFELTVYFGEYLSEEPIKLEVSGPWTVKETITQAISAWNVERAMMPLKGRIASCYVMRGMDVDEIDVDLPAFGAHLKVHDINEKCVGLTFQENEPVSVPSDPSSVIQFKNASEQILVKVSIPGPNNESHVLAIDKDATALTVRDLISLLNKKKHGAHFHPHYFNFYYNQRTKAKELKLQKCIIDLEEPRELILLPKFLTANDDINEAYNFLLVRLANERREYHCTKIRNARKNQKRMLIVDRHRIVKKAMDYNIGTNDHAPIDITSINNCSLSDKNGKQFSIEYRKQQGGKRQQTYELVSETDCKEIVNKIRYLITLRSLVG